MRESIYRINFVQRTRKMDLQTRKHLNVVYLKVLNLQLKMYATVGSRIYNFDI